MRTKEYIIDTEDINRPEIEQALGYCGITGYTIIEQTGCYSKHLEKSISIVVIDDGIDYIEDRLYQFIELVKVLNKQDTIYVEIQDLDLVMV